MLLCLTWQVTVLNVYCVEKGAKIPYICGKHSQLLNITYTNGLYRAIRVLKHFKNNFAKTSVTLLVWLKIIFLKFPSSEHCRCWWGNYRYCQVSARPITTLICKHQSTFSSFMFLLWRNSAPTQQPGFGRWAGGGELCALWVQHFSLSVQVIREDSVECAGCKQWADNALLYGAAGFVSYCSWTSQSWSAPLWEQGCLFGMAGICLPCF